jgi:hypothetical protein
MRSFPVGDRHKPRIVTSKNGALIIQILASFKSLVGAMMRLTRLKFFHTAKNMLIPYGRVAELCAALSLCVLLGSWYMCRYGDASLPLPFSLELSARSCVLWNGIREAK